MDKKGFSFVLALLIFGVVTLIVLIVLTFTIIQPFLLSSLDDSVCLITIIVKSAAKSGFLNTIPFIGEAIPQFETPIPLVCKLHSKLVKDKEEAKKTIAKEMANCWGRMGEGRFDIYSSIQLDFWNTNNVCFVCARVRSKENIIVSSGELASYLSNNKPRPLFDERTYLDYITGTGYETLKLEQRIRGVSNYEIREDKSLFILYFVSRSEDWSRKVVRFLATSPFALLIPGGAYFKLGGLGLAAVFASIQKKGFNANIIATDSEGVKTLCSSFG